MAGEDAGEIEVLDAVFGATPNAALIHQVIVGSLANRRQGTVKTKTRAEVSGGGAKPRPQKHTGRARAGSIRSPIWRGGGVAFGPSPRNYRRNTPKRMRRGALVGALSGKTAEGGLVVIEKFDPPRPKTKDVVAALAALGAGPSVLLVADGASKEALRAARNIPKLDTAPSHTLNALDLINHRTVVMTVEAVRGVESVWGGNAKAAPADDEPVAETPADAEPDVEMVGEEPAAETTADAEPDVETTVDAEPVAETPADAEPDVEMVDDEPAAETPADAESDVEMADDEPAAETPADDEPDVEMVGEEPAAEMPADAEPDVETAPDAEPDAEMVDDEPVAETTPDDEPAVETTPDDEPAAETTPDAESDVEVVDDETAVETTDAAADATPDDEPAAETTADAESSAETAPAAEASAETPVAESSGEGEEK